ncbi:MAG: hypothetical protein JXB13_19375, partial [Phycisphaerae bacterium]|nr:hypothetical protein [Phycisphaerae bacterium]
MRKVFFLLAVGGLATVIAQFETVVRGDHSPVPGADPALRLPAVSREPRAATVQVSAAALAKDTAVGLDAARMPAAFDASGLPVAGPLATWMSTAGSHVSVACNSGLNASQQIGRDAPPNDDCANAVAFDLIPGAPFTYSGDNTGATQDCSALGTAYREVWFKLTTHETLNEISVRYCGTSPAFQNVYTVLTTSCPCGEFITAYSHEYESCGDGNFSLSWRGTIPAGTYYWPLLTDSAQAYAEGPYTVTFQAVGPMPALEFPAEALFGQTPQRGVHTSGTSGSTAYTVYDNFSGMTQRIGGVEWWGTRLIPGTSGWMSCPPETPMEFRITLYRDNGGKPGDAVGSHVVTPTATYAAPYAYLCDTLHFSSGPLSPCYFLESGWISIESLPNPDGCVFLWMSSPDGDLVAYQGAPGSSPGNVNTDMSFCLMPGECPDVYGACCDADTGLCQWAEANNCFLPLQFTAGVQCADLTPPCGTPGACCSNTHECVFTALKADCDAANGWFFEGQSCEDPNFVCPDICNHRVDLRSNSDGWYGNTLDVLVNGEIVLSQITLADGTGPASYYFPAETGDTIETIFSTMLGAIITGTTLVVTISQLVISQENGP